MSQPLQKRTDFYSPRPIACLWGVKAHSLSPPLRSCPWNTKLQISACVHAGTSVLSDSLQPYECSPPGFSVHGILQERILEWVAISPSRGSSWPRHAGLVCPALAGRFFTTSTTWKALQISRGIAIKIIWLASPETDSLHFSLIYSWIQVKDKFSLVLAFPLKKKNKKKQANKQTKKTVKAVATYDFPGKPGWEKYQTLSPIFLSSKYLSPQY